MNKVVLVPGLVASTFTLRPLRAKLEAAGFECYDPGFDVQTAVHGELDVLARTLRELGRAVVVGHSLGGLQAVTLALADNPHLVGVIGLGSPVFGYVHPRVPYFEARSVLGWAVPLFGPTEIKRFMAGHISLPFVPAVQDWVVTKLRGLFWTDQEIAWQAQNDLEQAYRREHGG